MSTLEVNPPVAGYNFNSTYFKWIQMLPFFGVTPNQLYKPCCLRTWAGWHRQFNKCESHARSAGFLGNKLFWVWLAVNSRNNAHDHDGHFCMGHGLTSNKWHQRFLADTWSILCTLIRPLQRCFSHPACLRGMNLNSNNTAWSPTNKSSKNGHQITSQTNMINGGKQSQPAKYCSTFYIYIHYRSHLARAPI